MEKLGALVTFSGSATLCLTFTNHSFKAPLRADRQIMRIHKIPEKDFCGLTRQRWRFLEGAHDVRSLIDRASPQHGGGSVMVWKHVKKDFDYRRIFMLQNRPKCKVGAANICPL